MDWFLVLDTYTSGKCKSVRTGSDMDRPQNLIYCFLARDTSLVKVSCKSVHYFLQGSHTSWKTWKIMAVLECPEKDLEKQFFSDCPGTV